MCQQRLRLTTVWNGADALICYIAEIREMGNHLIECDIDAYLALFYVPFFVSIA